MTKPKLFSTWSYPTEVRFGVGRIAEICDACSALNIERPLIVTDTGLANSEIIKNLTELIETGDLKMGLFSKVQGNPVGKNIEEVKKTPEEIAKEAEEKKKNSQLIKATKIISAENMYMKMRNFLICIFAIIGN